MRYTQVYTDALHFPSLYGEGKRRVHFLCLLLCWIPLSLFGAGDTLRVLCIGNSFSIDAVEQELLPLAEAEGIPLRVGNLYIAGCSLRQHAANAQDAHDAYSYRELYGTIRLQTDSVSLRHALQAEPWDVITMQQASHDSGLWDTYAPFLQIIIDTVRSYCPHARLAWHQTWAYETTATHPGFANYNYDQTQMYHAICACADSVMKYYPFDILIPTGDAVQWYREQCQTTSYAYRRYQAAPVTRDGFHLSFEYGRYMAACVWLESLTGKRVHRHNCLTITYYGYPDKTTGCYSSVPSRSVRSACTERRCRRTAHRSVSF